MCGKAGLEFRLLIQAFFFFSFKLHSLIPQTFIEHQLSVVHSARCQGYTGE